MFMYCICTPGVNSCCVYSYVLGQRWRAHVHVHCTCICSGGRALMAKVRGPRFNPGWLPVFLSPLKIFLSISIMYMYSPASVWTQSTATHSQNGRRAAYISYLLFSSSLISGRTSTAMSRLHSVLVGHKRKAQ